MDCPCTEKVGLLVKVYQGDVTSVVSIFVDAIKVVKRADKVNKCITEGLMHVATWYREIPGSKVTKCGE